MVTAIGIAGSPRRNGNSNALLSATLVGAATEGATVATVHLNDLTFRGCQGCDRCSPGGYCVVSDPLSPVLAALRLADIWILASPIYFDGVSGQMKLFYDRLRTFMTEDGQTKPRLVGRRRAAIIVTSEAKPYDAYLTAVKSLSRYFGWMGDFGCVEVVCEGELGPVGAAAADGGRIERAQALGRQLVADLRGG
ncbi:MAG: flavodoxin family protein [Armatimonadota bacterium]